MKKSIIYLLGFPGVGKLTIAKELCKNDKFVLMDNHRINNCIFPFIDLSKKIPEEVWETVLSIREKVYDFIERYPNIQKSIVFTNALFDKNNDDLEVYQRIEKIASTISCPLIPIRLICSKKELKKRIQSDERKENCKLTSTDIVDNIYNSEEKVIDIAHPNKITIDVTMLSPQEVVKKIEKHIKSINCNLDIL
ncbi:MAG: AAA family ATPase [Lactobacillales bacterium]|jgi:adenylate kinase family enzyme|nr:AAA family ATPase [Lactobacillales bacterium]